MIILIHFIFAFIIAAALAALLGVTFGRRGVRRAGRWPLFVFFFLLIFLATWAGGVWLAPFGPVFWGQNWLPFLVIGIFVALLLTAMLPPPRPPRSQEEAARALERDESTDLTLGLVFWLTIGLLLLILILRYV